MQSIIFKCSLVIIYTGYFMPFVSALSSRIELVNETMIIFCTYHLIMFTSLIADPETRYLCGWPLIFTVFILVVMNLVVMLSQALAQAFRKIKRQYMLRKRKLILQGRK